MPAQILAPGTTAALSTDVTIAAGSTGTVALFTAQNDGLDLPVANGGGNFLLPDGVSKLLLAQQLGGGIPHTTHCPINLKDPDGNYGPSGLQLTGLELFKVLGPGVWQVERPAGVALGVQSDV